MIKNLTDEEFINAVIAMRQGRLDERIMAKVFRFDSIITLRQNYMDAVIRFRKKHGIKQVGEGTEEAIDEQDQGTSD